MLKYCMIENIILRVVFQTTRHDGAREVIDPTRGSKKRYNSITNGSIRNMKREFNFT